jgi:hypothetical protein
VSLEALMVYFAQHVDLEGIFVRQVSDECLFVGPKAFHGLSYGFGIGNTVPWNMLCGAIA